MGEAVDIGEQDALPFRLIQRLKALFQLAFRGQIAPCLISRAGQVMDLLQITSIDQILARAVTDDVQRPVSDDGVIQPRGEPRSPAY